MTDDIRKDLNVFFYPASIAVVGAGPALNSFGTRYVQALLDFGFKGKIFPVDRAGEEVLGHKIYRSVLDIPDQVDLVVICISSRYVPSVLQDCVKVHVKAAIVLSSGFSEAGNEGRLLEDELKQIVQQGILVMGPNCFGSYCPGGGITIVPGGGFPKESGGTALIAQSGQLSEGIAGRSFGEGIRYSKLASFGNASDVNESDLLEYLSRDEDTRIITAYLEGVKDGRRFFDIALRNARKKPLLLWKVGLTRVGAAAATSHTGSMAGASAIWNAFFRQTGAIRITSLEDLVDTDIGFSCIPDGCGRRVAMVSGGGAGTVIGADACENAGLAMPPLVDEVDKYLHSVMPAVGTSIKNPLDIGTPHPPLKMFTEVLESLAGSDRYDVIVIRRIFFSVMVSKIFAGAAAPSYDEQEALLQIPVNIKKKFGKPVIIVLPEDLVGVENINLEEERRKIRDYFFANGIPVYLTEERAFNAISRLALFKANASLPYVAPEIKPEFKVKAITSIENKNRPTVLDEIHSKQILKEAGLNVTETRLAKAREEALTISKEAGYPVVMKIVSPQITHKSDVGGVKLGLKTPADTGRAYDEIMESARQKAPGAVIEGVSIQKMAPDGVELVIGMTKDPQFGPVLMFGLGGIFVEMLKDVSFRIVPLTASDATEMIREIKGFKMLEGFRGQAPVDISFLEDQLLKISRFIQQNPEIKEMDINPLIAYHDGAVAVDARIVME